MKKRIELWLLLLTFFALSTVVLQAGRAHSDKTEPQSTQPQATDTQKKNVQEYIELLGSNVREEKPQIMGAVLQLSKEDAAKFWPIYDEYDAELTKLNNLRANNIQEFARSYDQMTDEKAHEFMKTDSDSLKQRAELLSKYYDRVKGPLGTVNAARFVQIENQLLLIIDLQIDSSLPLGQE